MNNKNVSKVNLAGSDLMAVMLLCALVCTFFGKVLLSGESLYGSDFILQFYPWKKFLYDSVNAWGSLPLWNPYLFSGTPFIANIQASIFYPLGFLYYLLPTDTAYLYSTIMHCVLGAILMYLFMRFLQCSRTGSFLSGFIFIFNGYFMAHLYAGHLSFVQNYIWIPLIFLLVIKFMEAGGLKYAVAGGLALGVQILGGFPQIAFYTILSILLLSVYYSWHKHRTGGWADIFTLWSGTVLLIVTGFSVAAVQLLPTYEFMQLSTRAGGVDYAFATMDSLPPRNLLTFLFPLLFGSPVDGTYWVSDTGWEFWEFCGYVGVATLALVLLAGRKLLLDRRDLFFVLLILIALFLSFGKYNPLYPLIYRLPGFNSFRIPAQILFLYVFCMGVLSGKALDLGCSSSLFQGRAKGVFFAILLLALPLILWSCGFPESFCSFISRNIEQLRTGMKPINRIAFIMSQTFLMSYGVFLSVSVILYLRGRGSLRRNLFGWMFVCVIMVDLWTFSFPMIQSFDMRALLKKGDSLSPLRDDPGRSRSAVKGGCLIANAGLWYRFQDIQGYDPMILKRYVEYINRSQGLPPDNTVVNLHYVRDFNNRLIRMLNLKYVVLCETGKLGKTQPFIPRCRIVHRMTEKRRDEILDFMAGKEFDPMNMVVFEKDQAPGSFLPRKPARQGGELCEIIRYSNDEIELTAKLQTPGFLVMSEICYPGWEVYVDGKRGSIYAGNYLFRTVPLEAGHHRIRFVFNPGSLKTGALISVLSLLVSVIVIFLASRGGRSTAV